MRHKDALLMHLLVASTDCPMRKEAEQVLGPCVFYLDGELGANGYRPPAPSICQPRSYALRVFDVVLVDGYSGRLVDRVFEYRSVLTSGGREAG